MRQSPYQAIIAQHSEQDPRIIEGLMRLQHGTLDALSLPDFKHEVRLAEGIIAEVGIDTAKRYAGLTIGMQSA